MNHHRVTEQELGLDIPAIPAPVRTTSIPKLTRADYHLRSYHIHRRNAISHGASCLLVILAKLQQATIPEIADACGLTYQTVVSHLRRHDDLFHVTRHPRPRPNMVRLTTDGVAIVTEILRADASY